MRDDVLKIVNREQLVSCMNNTRWHALLEALNLIPVAKRVKYIDYPEVSNWQSGAWMPVPGYVEFSGGPTPLRFIEWLEVRKTTDRHGRFASDRASDCYSEIQNVLATMTVDVEETHSSFIIYGYRRASRHIDDITCNTGD